MSIEYPLDRELMELHGLGKREIRLIGFHTNPIRLTDEQVESLLTNHLRISSDPRLRQAFEKEIKRIAEYFLHNVALQRRLSASKSLIQLRSIESAARRLHSAIGKRLGSTERAAARLRKALKWDGESFETISRGGVYPWLRQAAERYGQRIGRPQDETLPDPVTDWGSTRLQSVIAGVRLLELLAKDAQEIVREVVQRAKKEEQEKARRVALERAERGIQKKTTEKKNPLSSKHTQRVTVYRLALCWRGAFGKYPGAGIREDKGKKPDSPFIRFARAYFDSMMESAGEQISADESIRRLFKPSDHTIWRYVKWFKARLKEDEERREFKARAKAAAEVAK